MEKKAAEGPQRPRFPLHAAVLEEDRETFDILIEIAAHPERIGELKKGLPWHQHKTKKNDDDKDEDEAEEEPVNIDDRDDEGCTALSCAVRDAKIEYVDLLLKHGANFQQRNDAGVTPLQEAVNGGDISCIRSLCNVGGNQCPVICPLLTSQPQPMLTCETHTRAPRRCGRRYQTD